MANDQSRYWQTYRSGEPSPSKSAHAALVAQVTPLSSPARALASIHDREGRTAEAIRSFFRSHRTQTEIAERCFFLLPTEPRTVATDVVANPGAVEHEPALVEARQFRCVRQAGRLFFEAMSTRGGRAL